MLIIGIDENGLGPLLGPLIVTAVAFETPVYDPELFWQIARGDTPADDSKKLFSRRQIKTAEQATLAWLGAFDAAPSTYAELVGQIVGTSPFPLICFENDPEICKPSSLTLPVWNDRSAIGRANENAVSHIKDMFITSNITPTRVRAFSICPGSFNAATDDPSMNKFKLDFQLMMQLVLDLAADYQGDVLALCGKVGSTQRYGPWLNSKGITKWSAQKEQREQSTYRIDSIGEVTFIRDADALHFPVAVASMVGKYLRELAMFELNQHLGEPGMRPASGYRDRITADFVEKTTNRRLEIGLSDPCFLRNS